jgi:hypothetical protein
MRTLLSSLLSNMSRDYLASRCAFCLLSRPLYEFPKFLKDTHGLTILFSAPEPAGATAPVPPTAASAPTTSTDAPTEAATKPADAPTTTTSAGASEPSKPAALDMPEIPASKPAAGMSATSGPLNDDPFSPEPKEEQPAALAPTPAAPAVQPTPVEK